MKKLSMIIAMLVMAGCSSMDMGRSSTPSTYNPSSSTQPDMTYEGGAK